MDLHLITQSSGYYFGYYEIGEFKLIDTNLVKVRSYPVHHCTKGRVSEDNNIYIGCRETDTHYLVKLNWKPNTNPEIIWKKFILFQNLFSIGYHWV